MLLAGKNAVVFGGGGSIGGAVGRAFAREGARVFLVGRTQAKLDAVAEQIAAAGGAVETAQLDAHDRYAIEAFVDDVARRAGSIDVCFNAVGSGDGQRLPLLELPLDDFLIPVTEAARTQFLTATAAARRMVAQGSGAIVMLSSAAARDSARRTGGHSLACAAIECLTRTLAAEVGRHGVRVVALRPGALRGLVTDTALGRLPRLTEVADTAAFVASERAGAMTGAVVDLTCGAIVD